MARLAPQAAALQVVTCWKSDIRLQDNRSSAKTLVLSKSRRCFCTYRQLTELVPLYYTSTDQGKKVLSCDPPITAGRLSLSWRLSQVQLTMSQPLTTIRLQGQLKRRVADTLLSCHAVKPLLSNGPYPVRIVCLSDTHNTFPVIPPGDVLIHAGDLTGAGSFDEMQAGITWLSSQPHIYKLYVAGNHDVLLDEAFLNRYPERRYGQTKTKEDLDWGSVIYLEMQV